MYQTASAIIFFAANFQLQAAIACETLIWSREEVKTAGAKSFDFLFSSCSYDSFVSSTVFSSNTQ